MGLNAAWKLKHTPNRRTLRHSEYFSPSQNSMLPAPSSTIIVPRCCSSTCNFPLEAKDFFFHHTSIESMTVLGMSLPLFTLSFSQWQASVQGLTGLSAFGSLLSQMQMSRWSSIPPTRPATECNPTPRHHCLPVTHLFPRTLKRLMWGFHAVHARKSIITVRELWGFRSDENH